MIHRKMTHYETKMAADGPTQKQQAMELKYPLMEPHKNNKLWN